MTMNTAIELDAAAKQFQSAINVKAMMYIVRRPVVSLKDDHQSGNNARASIYRATERSATVAVVSNSSMISFRHAVDK